MSKTTSPKAVRKTSANKPGPKEAAARQTRTLAAVAATLAKPAKERPNLQMIADRHADDDKRRQKRLATEAKAKPANGEPKKAGPVATANGKADDKPPMPVHEADDVLSQDAFLVIGGLPKDSKIMSWAREYARKLGRPLQIRSIGGKVVGTLIDADYLAAVKAALGKAATGPRTPRAKATEPTGKLADIVKIASRKQGASVAELLETTGWAKAPWKTVFSSPTNGRGLCDRFGYGLKIEKVEGVTRYFLTPPATSTGK
jgi:hypothetical protein